MSYRSVYNVLLFFLLLFFFFFFFGFFCMFTEAHFINRSVMLILIYFSNNVVTSTRSPIKIAQLT